MRRFNMAMRLLVAFFALVAGPAAAQDDVAELTGKLQHFLANAEKREVHEDFWADDLIYSSSSGLRFGKAEIMQGFDDASADGSEAPAVTYSGEDIDVRLYDDMAVVAFRLVGKPRDGSETLYYYNTGTFAKRNGRWRAVAWQATRIPPAAGS